MPRLFVAESFAPTVSPQTGQQARIREIAEQRIKRIHRRTDYLLAGLLAAQWMVAILAAKCVSPLAWAGEIDGARSHVATAVGVGAAIVGVPLVLVFLLPGRAVTRHAIAVAQMLIGALLIHLTKGRPETHFHVFGSLAILSFYGDWRVLITGTAVVALDHFFRGAVWPMSLYGESTGVEWRWLEHLAWLVFIDVFLIYSCLRARDQVETSAARQARLEAVAADRTQEAAANARHARTLTSEREPCDAPSRPAKQAADIGDRAMSEFLANLSQEIRAPVNGIRGLSERVLESKLTREQRDALEMVRSSADALIAIFNDVLDFAKLEASRLVLAPVEFRLQDVLDDSLRPLALHAHHKGLELTCDVATDVPDFLVGDAHRLRQVLFHLIGNAVRFTETGEVNVRVALASESEAGCVVRFSVADTGVGIAPEWQWLIFDPFAATAGSKSRRRGGVGLGLPLSARLAALMGGALTVDSALERGSTFRFAVPLDRSEKPRTLPIGAAPAGILRDLPVLVVDDNATSRRLLEAALMDWQCRPTLVANAQDALVELRRAARDGEPHRLFLVDAAMPERDGFSLAEEIMRQPDRSAALILMLSPGHQRGDTRRGRELGVAAQVRKPIHRPELFNAILIALNPESRASNRAHPSYHAEKPPMSQNESTSEIARSDAASDAAVFARLETLERVGSDEDLLAEISAAFIAACPRMLFEIRDAIENENAEALKRSAHALKGSLGYLGAGRAVAMALQLESLAAKGSTIGAEAIFADLNLELTQFIAVLTVSVPEATR